MIKRLLAIILFCGPALAGISVKYDAEGNVTRYRLRRGPLSDKGCLYYTNEDAEYTAVRDLLKSTSVKWLRVVDGKVVALSQAERDAIIAAEQAAAEAEQVTSSRAQAIDYLSANDGRSVVIRASLKLIANSLVQTRNKVNECVQTVNTASGSSIKPLPNRTWEDLVVAVQQIIESGQADE